MAQDAGESERKARLAAALRENLKRRKAQGRARAEDEAADAPFTGSDGENPTQNDAATTPDIAAKDATR